MLKWGSRKYQEWTSRPFDKNDPEDMWLFEYLKKVVLDFDFVFKEVDYVYGKDKTGIHVTMYDNNETMEVWLLKQGFTKVES